MSVRTILLAVLLSLCSERATIAQQPYRFESQVDMVLVPVAVTDKDGNFVTDLAREDFAIYEDGERQEVAVFAAGLDEPWVELAPALKEELSGEQVIGLILDASGSMEDQIRLVHEAALKFLSNIPKTRHLFIVDFDENIRLSEYSSDDQRSIAERIYDVEAEGWTALYDVVATFLDRVYGYGGIKTLVVFSDGMDSRSTLSFAECVDMVKASDVTIHTIHFGEDLRSNSQRRMESGRFLRRIAELSGGSYELAVSLESLDEHYDRILEELFSQYILGYQSTNTKAEGRYREIKVEVNRRGLKWRARRGYVGPVLLEEQKER